MTQGGDGKVSGSWGLASTDFAEIFKRRFREEDEKKTKRANEPRPDKPDKTATRPSKEKGQERGATAALLAEIG